MKFSEKLSALLSLTATKNVTLARAVNIDTAQISRMRTGARGMPLKNGILRDISDFLAGRFDGDYKRSALYELTGDSRLQADPTEAAIAAILYDFLSSPDDAPESHAGKFLSQLGGYSERRLPEGVPRPKSLRSSLDDEGGGFVAYYKNDGKRLAAHDFLARLLAMERPCTVRVFTDEAADWLTEDRGFSAELDAAVAELAQRGFRIQRIQPPSYSSESAFRAIERWLPAYMSGSIKTFYYPWARDELHRRTVLAAPGQIALYSASLFGQRESQMTFLTTESSTVAAADAYFGEILERCRTMMSIFSEDDPKRLLERISALARIEDDGVYKASRLSAHTLPVAALTTLRQRCTPATARMLDCYAGNEPYKTKLLRDHKIVDILCLPKLEDVLAGREPVPGTRLARDSGLCYTAKEYRLHLKHILWYLETFPNYQAILADEPLQQDLVVYTKGDSRALLVREAEPYTLFEITERELASALCAYLRQKASEHIRFGSREATIETLRREVARTEEAIARSQRRAP